MYSEKDLNEINGKIRKNWLVLAPVLAQYPCSAVVMAGDRLSTDKKLAENAGIDFICVLSGECTAEAVAREAIAPTVLVEHLGLALP